ncbi:MAG: hypothetical protein MUF00_05585 [Gemmatimonadaceae bacterium]|jgi:hypothetical protein|nr:hypothetical protein [Gemmatimonadaceae bacterium]
MSVRQWPRCAAASLLLLVACGDKEDPAVATTIEPGTSLQQAGVVASQVNTIPSVLVKDQRGRPMGNAVVRWTVTTGGGRIGNDSIRTDGSGAASAGSWVLGTRAGANTVQASIAALAPVTFTATAAPGTPNRLLRLSADNQRAVVDNTVAAAPAARAVDEYDNAVAGVNVRFEVTRGGGSLTGTDAVTDTAGVARATTWRLGRTLGVNSARASVAGNAAVAGTDFNAFATAGPATTMRLAIGDNQTGAAGATLPIAPAVRIADSFNNPVGGVPVTFTVGTASGSLSATTAVTDSASGLAFAGQWTLGADSIQTVTARTAELPAQTVTFRARTGVSRYNIDARFVGTGGSPSQRLALQRAVARWQEIIVGSVHRIAVDRGPGACGVPAIPAIRDTITDLLVFIQLDSIDGPSRVLARAGPCLINSVSRLALVGFMQVDTADMTTLEARNLLVDVMTHEFGHVIGIGTLWEEKRLLTFGVGGAAPCTAADDPFFTGTLTRQRFADAGGTTFYTGTPVPVENRGGGGTACGHWREAQFRNELMQGFAKAGGMPLSAITAASLADLGYPVSFARTDPFAFLPALLSASQNADPTKTRLELVNDIWDADIFQIDPRTGRTSLYRPGRFK